MSKDSIDVAQLPNLSDMTDSEIDAFASQLWESIPQPFLPNETVGE